MDFQLATEVSNIILDLNSPLVFYDFIKNNFLKIIPDLQIRVLGNIKYFELLEILKIIESNEIISLQLIVNYSLLPTLEKIQNLNQFSKLDILITHGAPENYAIEGMTNFNWLSTTDYYVNKNQC